MCEEAGCYENCQNDLMFAADNLEVQLLRVGGTKCFSFCLNKQEDVSVKLCDKYYVMDHFLFNI